jgi:hypothetical protein
MTETATPILPKPPGRPAIGRDPVVQIRMPLSLINDIESWAAKFEKLDRSAAVRALIELGLRAGRKTNQVLDPKGYRCHDRKIPPVKRPPPGAVSPTRLRVVSKE